MLYAIDRRGPLFNLRRTATGGYQVDARLARVGDMSYPKAEGGATVHRNSAEVLQAAMDDLPTVPVTNRHPPKFVTPANYRQYAAGPIVGAPSFDGTYIVATLAIQDADLIQDIEDGVSRELSMGYTFDGEIVDGVLHRTKIAYNHAAVLPAGRAGSEVGLVLDSSEIPTDEVPVKLKIQGAEVAADSAQSAIDTLEAQLAAARSELEVARAATKTATDKLDAATSDEAIAKAVSDKLAKDAAAKEAAERLDRVKAGFPSISFDGKNEAYIQAYDEQLAERVKADPDGLGKIKDAKPVIKVEDAPASVKSARDQMLDALSGKKSA